MGGAAREVARVLEGRLTEHLIGFRFPAECRLLGLGEIVDPRGRTLRREPLDEVSTDGVRGARDVRTAAE